MIRNASSADLPALKQIAEDTRMFLGEELDSFLAEITAHLSAVEAGEESPAALIVAAHDDDAAAPLGAAFFMPELMAQGVMNLLFVGVLATGRRQGFGRALLDRFEDAARKSGARLAIIETASEAMFAPAWALYRGAGYGEEARVRDYYDDGLDKLIFRKRL